MVLAQHEQVREQVTRNQKRAATQMLESARKKLKIAAVGDNVRIPIPLYDRAKGDQRNLLGLITDVDENGLFTIQTNPYNTSSVNTNFVITRLFSGALQTALYFLVKKLLITRTSLRRIY